MAKKPKRLPRSKFTIPGLGTFRRVGATSKITADFVKRVLALVGRGLSEGVGSRKQMMCVEAAVAYAAGEDYHTDKPACVDYMLASMKIELNDNERWNSPQSRAKGLKRLAVAQLGSRGKFSKAKFYEHVVTIAQERVIEQARTKLAKLTSKTLSKLDAFDDITYKLRAAKNWPYKHTVTEEQEDETTKKSPAWSSFYQGDIEDILAELRPDLDREDEKFLMELCELYVQALIRMKIPGTKFLYLTEGKQNRKAVLAKMRRRKAKKQKSKRKSVAKKRRNKK